MAKISLLSDLVADQIAAGEVVENPASAVKELMENALDAGASEIVVSIVEGGLSLLCVEDDGCGMDREDALLCLKRHATSKIRSVDDLEALATMGFRGEALAALSSISKLEIKTSDGTESCHIAVDGGAEVRMTPCVRNRGTTVVARSLFYNTPARLKFQKSPGANAAAVLKVVQTLSLAHPKVRFTLTSNGKVSLRCQQMDWKLRAEELLGSFAHQVKAPMVYGLLGSPSEGKVNRSGQMLYINRRPIFSPLIAKAVKEGFGTRMDESLFPTFLLFLDLPPDSIDVNVHPQKREVRFRNEGFVYQMVRNAVFQAFEGIESSPAILPWEIGTPASFDFTQELAPLPPLAAPSFRLEDAPLPIENVSKPLVLLGDFLLVQQIDAWQLVDLRGAEARVVFEAIEGKTCHKQQILWPIEYRSENPEELVEALKELQFEARVLGKQMIAIDSLPENLEAKDVVEFIQALGTGKETRKVAAALTRTYRSVSRKYSLWEAGLIWEKLGKCADSRYDPLGRKIVTLVTKELLTGMFT